MTSFIRPAEAGLDDDAGRPEDPELEVQENSGDPAGRRDQPRTPRSVRAGAWPLWALLVLYPVWWLLGLGTFIFPILAVPMAIYLVRHRPIKVPPGFGIWLLFL